MPNSFEWRVAQLEGIANGVCQCNEDNTDVYADVCRVCRASRALNRMSADAFDSLEELTVE